MVWELMHADDTVNWLGAPLPDQHWYEQHLPGLLAVRARLRAPAARAMGQRRYAW